MLDSKAANYWLPVDIYIGGIEYVPALLPLLPPADTFDAGMVTTS